MVRTRLFFFVFLLYFQYILVECKECITTQDSIGDQKAVSPYAKTAKTVPKLPKLIDILQSRGFWHLY